jgi:hypothetical protein
MNFTSNLIFFPIISALYLPPLYVWSGQRFLRRFEWLTYPAFTFPVGALISGLLYVNYPAPGFIATYLIFMFFNVLTYTRKINRVTGFSLAVYASFAISELWEIPIHLYNWSNVSMLENGVIFFTLKISSLIFFFHLIRQTGWKPSFKWIVLLTYTIFIGIFMYGVYPLTLWGMPFYDLHMYLHLYRVPWIILFAWCLT